MLLPLVILLCSSLIAHAEAPPSVLIRNIQAIGSGCPQGSFSATISPDANTFSLLLDQYIAESTRQMTLDRKACQLRVEFAVPSGWQFSVISADYRGFVNVEAGALATHQAIYSFDGSKPPNERPGFQDGSNYSFKAQNFNGPFQDNYFIHNEINPRIAPWSPCQSNNAQTLFISTFLTARALDWRSPAAAQITLDSIDGQAQSQKFNFAWRRCRADNPAPGRPPTYPGRPPRFP